MEKGPCTPGSFGSPERYAGEHAAKRSQRVALAQNRGESSAADRLPVRNRQMRDGMNLGAQTLIVGSIFVLSTWASAGLIAEFRGACGWPTAGRWHRCTRSATGSRPYVGPGGGAVRMPWGWGDWISETAQAFTSFRAAGSFWRFSARVVRLRPRK
jgi:hypothetical protein